MVWSQRETKGKGETGRKVCCRCALTAGVFSDPGLSPGVLWALRCLSGVPSAEEQDDVCVMELVSV